MTPHQMLDALSRQTGAALAFNGDGLCRLRFDGRFIVDLEVTPSICMPAWGRSLPVSRAGN